jgi:hypothetical protein
MVQSESSPQSTIEGEVLVIVSYAASRRGQWEGKYSSDTALSVVREAAMTFFGVADHIDSAGNGERFELVDRGDTPDLSTPIGELADSSHNLALRLVRQLVAG